MTKELKKKLEARIWRWLCYIEIMGMEVRDLKEYAKDMAGDILGLLYEEKKVEDFDSTTDTYILNKDENYLNNLIIEYNPNPCRTDSISINSIDDPTF